MAICPKDMKPCIDDICYGGGCLKMAGVMPLRRCDGCGALITIDGDDPFEECECDEDIWEDADSIHDPY